MEMPTCVGTLIVDDEQDVRTLLRLIIQAANQGLFVAGEAADADEALETIDAIDPRVVVLDQMMPGMCGIDAAKKMLERRPSQIIILFTAYLDEELRRDAAAAGIKLCVAKDDLQHIPDALHAIHGAAS
jgi:DNA-binding NarL/FixJ family response regulator